MTTELNEMVQLTVPKSFELLRPRGTINHSNPPLYPGTGCSNVLETSSSTTHILPKPRQACQGSSIANAMSNEALMDESIQQVSSMGWSETGTVNYLFLYPSLAVVEQVPYIVCTK